MVSHSILPYLNLFGTGFKTGHNLIVVSQDVIAKVHKGIDLSISVMFNLIF